MKRRRLVVAQAFLTVGLSALICAEQLALGQKEQLRSIDFFDVLDLPARIDEPRLRRNDGSLVLDCEVANRSGEQLLGLRLIMMTVDSTGKVRSRITWSERVDVPAYSIRSLVFHPSPRDVGPSDQLFLGIDEVIGRETIWRAEGAEKALRAYSRGQHELFPAVRILANKFDPRPKPRIIP